jgi:site-specific DNA-methyltransferase (adenine-specific)
MTGTTPIDTIICGDCLEEMKKLPGRSIDAIVTDPPYELAFMGKKWDASGIAYNVDMWGECLRVLKPGGHLLAFGGSRTYHRMACAIEDAGFEIRDSIHWVYGSGFPKSLSIDKALDKMAGAEREVIGFGTNGMGRMNQNNAKAGYRPNPYSDGIDGVPITTPSTDAAKQWAGWGSALKPAHEPIVLARKPLDGCTIAENVLRWGCGGLNVDGCRIETNGEELSCSISAPFAKGLTLHKSATPGIEREGHALGRFPSNLIHDGSEPVLAEFAKAGTTKSGAMKKEVPAYEGESTTGFLRGRSGPSNQHGDSGSVARFFQSCSFQEEDIPAFAYYAKAGPSERNGSTHPTMKPLSLMRYLCKLITPPGGTILDPFGGSGTTGIAAIKEGFHYILIEQQEEYCEIARKRIAAVPARLDRWAEADA